MAQPKKKAAAARSAAAQDARPVSRAMPSAGKPAVERGRKVYRTLADLPELPKWKTKANGDIATRVVNMQDEDGKKFTVTQRIPWDEEGKYAHRNRFGEMLMYELTLQKVDKNKAGKRQPLTVGDRRYTALRGSAVIVPWFIVHMLRTNIETKYRQEPDPQQSGRFLTIAEEMPSDSFQARPIDPCDDFDDQSSHLPKSDPGSGGDDLPPYLRGEGDPTHNAAKSESPETESEALEEEALALEE